MVDSTVGQRLRPRPGRTVGDVQEPWALVPIKPSRVFPGAITTDRPPKRLGADTFMVTVDTPFDAS